MKKFTLVLEGGGMRGLFTAGVLDFFLDKGLEPDLSIGVSAGALNASNFKAKQKRRSLRVNINYCDDKRYMSLSNLAKEGEIFNMNFLFHEISDKYDPFDYDTFANSKQRLIAVMTNMNTGEAAYPYVINMHTDYPYVQASSSLPLVGNKVHIDGNDYLDGGVADSVPLDFAMAQSNEKVVVVLTRAPGYRKEKMSGMSVVHRIYKNYPKFVKQLEQRHIHYNDTINRLEQLEQAGDIFVIQPATAPVVGRVEKSKEKLMALYNDGYQTAERLYEDLVTYLET